MSNFYAEEIQRQIDQIKDPEERSRKQAEYEDLSVFRDILPFIPINVKQYAYYMMGGKGELNENDLTDAELNVLYDIASKKLNDPNFSVSSYSDSNKITYPDYETGDYSDISRGNPADKEAQVQEQLNAWERGEKKLNLEAPDGKTKTYSYEEYVQDFPGAFDDPLSVVELAKKLKDPNYSMKTTIGKADIVENEDGTYSVQDQYDFEYGKGKGESSYDSFFLSPYAIARNLAAKRKNKGSPVDINLGSEEYIKRQGMYNGGEVSYLQSALNMLTESAPVTEAPPGTFDLGTIEPFNPIMDRYKPNPLDEFAMMMVGPTSKARLAQLANPTDEVFATATRKEILDYIKTIPLKIRLALRADDSIPLKGKYAILDSDKIDFYEDVVNLNKLPKNFKTGDNTLGKIYMEKNSIPSRVDMSDPLMGFKPRPYFEEIVDKKGVEKIKLYFPKTGRLEPYGTQTKYRQKTLTNPSKEQLDKLFKGIKESDLKKELTRVQKAEKLDVPNATAKDMAEATQLRMGTPYRTSEEISKELLDLQGTEKLDLDLLAKLRKEFNL